MLLIFSGSDWCGWCKLMDGNVFSKKSWEKASASMNLISVLIDFPQNQLLVPAEFKPRNQSLKSKYGIRGYPTYILLDSSLNQIGKLGAGRDKTVMSFANEVKALLPKTKIAVPSTRSHRTGGQAMSRDKLWRTYVANARGNTAASSWLDTSDGGASAKTKHTTVQANGSTMQVCIKLKGGRSKGKGRSLYIAMHGTLSR